MSRSVKLAAYQKLVETPYLYSHWKDAQKEWDSARWPNFMAEELACPLAGSLYLDPYAIDILQAARYASDKEFIINSAHRSLEHNKNVGGAPNSAHLQIAFDISLRSIDGKKHHPLKLKEMLLDAGFTRFGLYGTFIHVDTRPRKATWYGTGSKQIWTRRPHSTS